MSRNTEHRGRRPGPPCCKRLALSSRPEEATMSRWTTILTRAEWLRLSGFGAAVLFLHLLGWGLFLYYARHNPALAGLGSLAYTFGLRHAFDADHIAAIDNTTRKFLQDGKRSMGTGFFFSLGHSSACRPGGTCRSEEHTSELQSLRHLVCRLLLEKKNKTRNMIHKTSC